jgi:hypothetical protein
LGVARVVQIDEGTALHFGCCRQNLDFLGFHVRMILERAVRGFKQDRDSGFGHFECGPFVKPNRSKKVVAFLCGQALSVLEGFGGAFDQSCVRVLGQDNARSERGDKVDDTGDAPFNVGPSTEEKYRVGEHQLGITVDPVTNRRHRVRTD